MIFPSDPHSIFSGDISEVLDLSPYILKKLEENYITYIGALVSLTRKELENVDPCLTRKLCDRIENALAKQGLQLAVKDQLKWYMGDGRCVTIEIKVHTSRDAEFEARKQLLLTDPTELFDLTTRTSNALKKAEIDTIAKLIMKSCAQLLELPNFGRKSLREIEENLSDIGMRLNYAFDWTYCNMRPMTPEDRNECLMKLAKYYDARPYALMDPILDTLHKLLQHHNPRELCKKTV